MILTVLVIKGTDHGGADYRRDMMEENKRWEIANLSDLKAGMTIPCAQSEPSNSISKEITSISPRPSKFSSASNEASVQGFKLLVPGFFYRVHLESSR